MAKPDVRKQDKYVPLTKEQFRERFFARYYDPAFDPVKGELEKVFEVADLVGAIGGQLGEVPRDEKASVSHRGQAFAQLRTYLVHLPVKTRQALERHS